MNRATSSDGWVRNHDNKTLGFTCSIITGCRNDCPFPCFARVLANGRLRDRYLANPNYAVGCDPNEPFTPRFWSDRVEQVYAHKAPAGIFLNIMGEWAGDWVPVLWQLEMLDMLRQCPHHRFYLLTKQYQNLHKFSPFPENCYVGVSIIADGDATNAYYGLSQVEAGKRFLSIEPLLGAITMKSHRILEVVDWLIIGCLTGTKAAILNAHKRYPALTPAPMSPQSPNGRWCLYPKVEWVTEICEAAAKAGIPIFLKHNLRHLLPEQDPLFNSAPHTLRQEMPEKEANTS